MRFVVYFLILLVGGNLSLEGGYSERRQNMIKKQIEERGISHEATLEALRATPRHEFVPVDLQKSAYDDRPLPIGHGQTISQPYIVAYMTEQLRPEPHFRVLEIGCGSGYQAAILSKMVKQVFTVEIVPELAQKAKTRLQTLGYDNVHVKQGDGFYGWKEEAPFDLIIVTAAAEHIPPPLIEQLKDGGRMMIPVGSPFGAQRLVLITKKGDEIQTENMIPVRFVPFTREEP